MFRQVIESPIGPLGLCANEQAIVAITFDAQALPSDRENAITAQAAQQLAEYFAGARTAFTVKLAPKGTAFQNQVWQALLATQYGKTCSYRHIAEHIDNPKAVRAVGAANGKNPIPVIVPCHRIIGANGKLTGYAGGLDKKEILLALERNNSALSVDK
uniref:methylated-DNA--[protein]-cysteine S-methyltransferase n=1 Tax=Thaumasiovibrio occultus TaxID=1891184 RepID=UPI000B35088C|nr:methylated-DNA--[protein]-cysteine S-methyltransferase [Thaumasiovibrio occultus]